MSVVASRTVNPIRRIVDMMKVKPNPSKKLIPLTIGDPTIHGNFKAPDHIGAPIFTALGANSHNGYPHACGIREARESVARTHSVAGHPPLTVDDIVLTCGCSQAIDMAISVLANPGTHNILLPRPGFSLYETLCKSKGVETRFYSLGPNRQWECDLAEMESLIDSNTSAILINNPSNPCGSNFSRSHIQDIISLASKYELPIIADEIYENLVFSGSEYTSFAEMSKDVPIIHVGGLAKKFMLPGWRLGWIALHDRHGRLSEIRKGLMDLSTLTLGPTSIVQSIVPDLLERTEPAYLATVISQLEENLAVIQKGLAGTPGIHLVVPQGAMYIMIGIDDLKDIEDDVDFAKKLVEEESVFVLPGSVFRMPNFFRIVITSPPNVLQEACERIDSFCRRYAR
jgi:tyrosine aminotransferase